MRRLLTLVITLCFIVTLSAQYSGYASYYNAKLDGNKTSSGEIYRHNQRTAASRDFPIGTILQVVSDDGRSTIVRVNDCGPRKADRIIDVSGAAAKDLGMEKKGVIYVRLQIRELGVGSLPCSDNYPVKPKSIFAPKPGGKTPPKSYDETPVKKIEAPTKTAATVIPQGTFSAEVLSPIKGGFGVQIASYTKVTNAQNRVAKLRKQGFSKILVRVSDKKYQVVMGPFTKKEIAASYQKNLKQKYKISGFVVSLK